MKDILLVFCIGAVGAGVYHGAEFQRTDQLRVVADQEGLSGSRFETPRLVQVVTTWRSEHAR